MKKMYDFIRIKTQFTPFTKHLLIFISLTLMITSCDNPLVEDPVISVSAGNDEVVDFGIEFTLNGNATISNGENISTQWEIIEKPTESSLTINNPEERSITLVPDALGDYIFRFTATGSSGISDFDEVMITVEYAAILLTNINEDRVLENIWDDPEIADYKVLSGANINAQLTIDPDVRIIFEQGARMTVSSSGSIIAKGTDDKPIVFTGREKTAGYWDKIIIDSNDPDNVFDHIIIEYAGLDNEALLINSGILSMQNSIVRNSGSYGIHLPNVEATFSSFINNQIMQNNKPVLCLLEHFRLFDETSDFSGNNINYIEGYTNRHVNEDGTWNKLNVPYFLPATINSIFADIVINPGVEIISAEGAGLSIINDGSLNAVGTEDESISFTAEEEIRGYWHGLYFSSNTNKNELTNVSILYGGGGGFTSSNLKSNVIVDLEGRLKLSNTTLSHSDGYGLILFSDELTLTEFTNNKITNNEFSVNALPSHFGFFDDTNTFSGNNFDFIETQSNKFWTVSNEAIWKKLDVPYLLNNSITTVTEHLEIEPGVEIVGINGSGMIFENGGTLSAQGTEEEPIIFRGMERIQGYWIGLRFSSISDMNDLSFVEVSDGGQSGFSGISEKVMIHVVGSLNTRNCSITNSESIGVFVDKNAFFNEMDNIYSDNPGGDVIYQ